MIHPLELLLDQRLQSRYLAIRLVKRLLHESDDSILGKPDARDGIWDSYPRKQLQLPHDIVAVLLVMALARDI